MAIIDPVDEDDQVGSTRASMGGSITSWLGWKERGRTLFQRGDYEAALNAYTQALRPDLLCPASEQQVLWSNIVACRLKIGGSRAQAEAAVQAAKRCVALNDSWAKAHIRLASAYIALGGHSNDACNALQRALQLDPGNRTARDMLVRELRRDRNENGSTTFSSPSPSAPPQDLDDRDYPSNGSSQARNSSASQQEDTQYHPPNDGNQDIHGIDTQISWQERSQFYVQRAKNWYNSQSDDFKSILKVLLGLIVLYVAFGGRFGLEYLSGNGRDAHRAERGNDAYQQFYRERRQNQQSHSSYEHKGSYDSYSGGRQPYDHQREQRSSRNNSSWSFRNSGNSVPSMIILAAVAYMAHRNGINPLQALFFVNMAMGRGRRRGVHHRGWGPAGMMGGGFRHYGGRPRW